MSPKEEQLVIIAWKTIRSKGTPEMEIAVIEDYVNYKSYLSHRKSIGNEDMHEVDEFSQYFLETSTEKGKKDCFEYVTFENFAMLLNLINNVYIKNNI